MSKYFNKMKSFIQIKPFITNNSMVRNLLCCCQKQVFTCEIVSVVNKDLLAFHDVVGCEDARDESESRMFEGHELGVRHEGMVRLVRERSSEMIIMENLLSFKSSSFFNFTKYRWS